MPKKAKRTRKTKVKTRKPMRRSRIKSKINSPGGIYKFTRTITSSDIAVSNQSTGFQYNNAGFCTITTTAVQGTQYFVWAPAFTLYSIPDYSEFTNLFDAYRITGVTMRWIPISNSTESQIAGGAGNNAVASFIHFVRDYDDNVVFTNAYSGVTAAQEYASYQMWRGTSSKTIRMKPKAAVAMYQGAFTGYGQTSHQWIDCNTNAYYYAFKMVMEAFVPTNNVYYMNFKVEFKFDLEFKNLR